MDRNMVSHDSVRLTAVLRACLLELAQNRDEAIVSAAQAHELVRLGLAARWANVITITHAGRRALYDASHEAVTWS